MRRSPSHSPCRPRLRSRLRSRRSLGLILSLSLAMACNRQDQEVGEFRLSWPEEGTGLSVDWHGKRLLDLEELEFGQGEAEVDFQVGSYKFTETALDLSAVQGTELRSKRRDDSLELELIGAGDKSVGWLHAWAVGDRVLNVSILSDSSGTNRARASFACDPDDRFLGLGAHAFDVDHRGEAFGLWVGEPGIGKSDQEAYPADWFLQGTRHSSSYPVPFILNPRAPVGVGVSTWSRVDVDLCASDPSRWSLTTWSGVLNLKVVAGDSPLEVVGTHTLASGAPVLPPDWAFAPWLDAIRGVERVRTVAATLRAAGAPASVIWTEDWKGSNPQAVGYQLSDEWEVDEALYPNAEDIAAELHGQGFKWLGYFAPFIAKDTKAASEAAEFGVRTPDGEETYWFTGAGLGEVTVLDPTNPDAVAWAEEKMTAALEIGLEGWMTDYAEWLPTDATLQGMDALDDHNAYPRLWQEMSAEVLAGTDSVFFTRSGWTGSQSVSPVTWAGDQRTSFEADDGLPTVLPMGIGLGISGVAFYTHDIAGYNSIGNAPTTKEVWFRWCALGAFTPIMRTHHGRFDEDNWQFDTDEETLAHFTRYAIEHARLFPYLRGLAEKAHTDGIPLVLAPALVYPEADWARIDAWLLGSALLVAPVMEAGAEGREVELPGGQRWFNYFSGAEVESGWQAAALGDIPVFAAEGTIIPLLAEAPDTFTTATDSGITTLSDMDGARELRVFGSGGRFTEADGTRYSVSGTATGPGEASQTLTDGTVEVGGLKVKISGSEERSYRVVVYP